MQTEKTGKIIIVENKNFVVCRNFKFKEKNYHNQLLCNYKNL